MQAQIANSTQILWTIAFSGVGGSVLALVGIWLEMRRGPRTRCLLSGCLSFFFGALAAVLWVTDQRFDVVVPFLGLGFACLAASALQVACVRCWARRMFEPWVIWTLLLVVSPVFALLYAHQLNTPECLPEGLADAGPAVGKESVGPRAVTDLGREIALFRYHGLPPTEAAEDSVLEAERLAHEVIRVEGPSAISNCHGWVFTGGAFGVPSEQVDTILADNGYLPVEHAQAGDLVICRSESGLVTHTGIVRFVAEDGMVLVESKWGPMGVFLHSPEMQPYGKHFDFWRSPRLGHQLEILPGTGAGMMAGSAAASP